MSDSKTQKFRETYNAKLSGVSKIFFDSIQTILVAMGVVFVLVLFVQPTTVVGQSMTPTLQSGEVILMNKVLKDIKRGDIITFDYNGEKDLIKRVIGLPGDKVELLDGQVLVNGTAIKEDYLSDNNRNIEGGTVIKAGDIISVPQDKYLVLGDNRTNSLDSRFIGLVEKDRVKGKAWIALWPLNQIHTFNDVQY